MRRRIEGQTALDYARKSMGVLIGRLRNRGGFLPPERELCKEIGVSRDTIKSAIERFEKEGLLEVRPRKGNYVVQATPLDFRIGIITGVGEMPFASPDNMAAIEGALKTFSRTPRTGVHFMHLNEAGQALELARQYALDGVLWIAPDAADAEAFEKLVVSGIPTIAAAPTFRRMAIASNYVGFDHRENGRIKARRLLARGCRKIVYSHIGSVNDSHLGFAEEMDKSGVDFGAGHVIRSVAELESRLPELIAKGSVDGFASEGDIELVKPAISILTAAGKMQPEAVIDCGTPNRETIQLFAAMKKLSLCAMPAKELGVVAAETLLSMKGAAGSPIKPTLVAACLVPPQKLFCFGENP